MMTCEEQLSNLDFIGGTLVEYFAGTQKELGRGTISQFGCVENKIRVDTQESENAKVKNGKRPVMISQVTRKLF
jgi:hypothetical protein